MIRCIFKDEHGINIYRNFYGSIADVLAANFFSAHPNYTLVSAQMI